MSILQGTLPGTIVYSETHSATTTNEYGLVNLEIGNGLVLFGIFTNINWRKGLFFLQTEMDATGGTEYQPMGIVQLLLCPIPIIQVYPEDCGSQMKTDTHTPLVWIRLVTSQQL